MTVGRCLLIWILALCFASAAAGDDGYDIPAGPNTKPHLEIHDDLYNNVSRVRLGALYDVVMDAGIDTWRDPDYVYICVKTRPSGRFKCGDLDRTYNLYEALYPFGTPMTFGRKHVYGGRVYLRVVAFGTRNLVMQRTLIVK